MAKRFRSGWLAALRQVWPVFLIILAVFILGLAAGGVGLQRMQAEQTLLLNQELELFFQQYSLVEIDTGQVLRGVLYRDAGQVLIMYVLGLTVIGIPALLGIIFLRGFALGFTVMYLTREQSTPGIALTIAAILPQNVLMVPALLLAGVASLSFALVLARRFNDSRVLVWPNFVVYSGLMALVLLCMAVAGLVEVYLTPLLFKYYTNYLL
ncbi:MAG: Stage II sporulation protein M [Pelotomaculum sp. PtaB.Bin104]|nr:MAG: Stage II sporulation protein M [Pelotomaculum sp. PtaB.Bin104]